MEEQTRIYSDNEYIIMKEIMEKEDVSQRKLAKKLGISLSTVNALINKMIKEGIIKMNQVSQKQVFYMLTPEGMMGKAKKTVTYLKYHYKAIFEAKEKIKKIFGELNTNNDVVFVLMSSDEIGEIVKIAIDESELSNHESKLVIVNTKEEINIDEFESPAIVYMSSNKEIINRFTEVEGLTLINLANKLVI